jgi:hypothetical protein
MCRDVLTCLRSGVDNTFTIHGSHPTLTPVDLPLWLPLTTLDNMVQLYRACLLKELVKMIRTKRKPTISDTPSFQSDGRLSIASNDSASLETGAPPSTLLYDVDKQLSDTAS